MLTSDQIRIALPALLLLPLAAALILRFTDGARARIVAILFAAIHFALTAVIVYSAMFQVTDLVAADANISVAKKQFGPVFTPRFVPGDPGPDSQPTGTTTFNVLPFGKDNPKIQAAQFFIGLDGINLWLIALASFMLIPVILISWDTIPERVGVYFSWLFVLQTGVLGVFLSFDLLFFYVCFELTLIPLLFLIGGYGPGPNRREAARKIFLYTLAGGIITLLGLAGSVLAIFDKTGELTFSIPRLSELTRNLMQASEGDKRSLWQQSQTYLFLAMALGFLIKIPVVPLHTWLPGAYSEAPTGTTVMMSALLAKMGTFGLLRVCLPLAPDATLAVGMPLIGVLGAVGIVYGAFCAYAQTDIRRVIAYSSISHLGLCVLAIVAFNSAGMSGSLLHMVNHGLSTGALFLVVGMLTRRYASCQVADYSGIWHRLPELTFYAMVIAMATVGVPGLNNFVSEVIMMAGIVDMRNSQMVAFAFVIVAALGVVLGSWYTMTLLMRVFFGPLKEPLLAGQAPTDLNVRERTALIPLVLACVLLGLMPNVVLDVMKRDVARLADVADEARTRMK